MRGGVWEFYLDEFCYLLVEREEGVSYLLSRLR